MDGGTVFNVNMEAAVRQCLDVVDDESKIIIDVLICGAEGAPEVVTKTGNGWESYFRGRNVRKFYGSTSSLAYSMAAHPKVQMRHIVHQNVGAYTGTSQLNFDGDFTWPA